MLLSQGGNERGQRECYGGQYGFHRSSMHRVRIFSVLQENSAVLPGSVAQNRRDPAGAGLAVGPVETKVTRLAALSIVLILAAGHNAAWMCGTTCGPRSDTSTCHQPSTSSARLTAASHCPTIGIPAVAVARDDAGQTLAATVGTPVAAVTPPSHRPCTAGLLRHSAERRSPPILLPLRV